MAPQYERPSLNPEIIVSSEDNLLVFTYRDLRKVRRGRMYAIGVIDEDVSRNKDAETFRGI